LRQRRSDPRIKFLDPMSRGGLVGLRESGDGSGSNVAAWRELLCGSGRGFQLDMGSEDDFIAVSRRFMDMIWGI
jgi:hypothetical protein